MAEIDDTVKENESGFSEAYLKWVKTTDFKDLTNTQHKFAEWLLLEENSKIISQIGNLLKIFISIRNYLKKI